MKQVFVLQNQHKQFLNKQGEWCDGREAKTLYNTEFKDEAINQQFEVSSKDYTLRVTLLRCKLDERRIPQIPSDNLPDAMEMPAEPAPAAAEEVSPPDEEPEPIVESVVAEVSTVADMFGGHEEAGAANDAAKPENLDPEVFQPQLEE